MDDELIFAPLLLQIGLTLAVYVRLTVVKAKALKSGEVDVARRALHDDAWPESVIQVNNNIRNQFETPVLFYVLVLGLYALGGVSVYAHAAAWLYALSRVAHALVHTGSNVVVIRRRVFAGGVLMLFVLCGLVAAAVVTHPA
jgi:hypothetical protein